MTSMRSAAARVHRMANLRYGNYPPNIQPIILGLTRDLLAIYQCRQFVPNYNGTGIDGLCAIAIYDIEQRIHPTLLHVASLFRHHCEGSIEVDKAHYLTTHPAGVGTLTKTGEAPEPLAPMDACNKILHGRYLGYSMEYTESNFFVYPPATDRPPYPDPKASFDDRAWKAEVNLLRLIDLAFRTA